MRGYGAVSLVVLLFSWLALDDITTDDATRFLLEYGILVLAGAWFAVLGGRLIAKRRVVPAISTCIDSMQSQILAEYFAHLRIIIKSISSAPLCCRVAFEGNKAGADSAGEFDY